MLAALPGHSSWANSAADNDGTGYSAPAIPGSDMTGPNASTRCAVVAAALLAALAGCSREQFRMRADKDVEGVISQKNLFPDWKVENWHVYPDSRARFADPSCPDYPAY